MWRLAASALVLQLGWVGAHAIEPNSVDAECPAGWIDTISIGGGFGCLLFKDTRMTCQEAARACQEDHGGFLLKVATPEQKVFVAMMLETLYGNAEDNAWWVGASDMYHEGVWVWPDLSPVDDFVWYPGHPSTRFDLNCAYMSAAYHGDMFQYYMTKNPQAFICQKERNQSAQLPSRGHPQLRRATVGPTSGQ